MDAARVAQTAGQLWSGAETGGSAVSSYTCAGIQSVVTCCTGVGLRIWIEPKDRKGSVMALLRRGSLSRIGVVMMVLGIGVALSGLFGGCGGGSTATGSESAASRELPLLDREAPGSLQTASFALG
jgi:hypothetical protein